MEILIKRTLLSRRFYGLLKHPNPFPFSNSRVLSSNALAPDINASVEKEALQQSEPSSDEIPDPSLSVPKIRSLVSLFTKPPNPSSKSNPKKISAESNSLPEEEIPSPKELSPDAITFVNHLYEKGYLRKANFFQESRFDADLLSSSYAQGFFKYATERFGYDHQDIAKWLSGSDLKKVTLLGCPSVEKRVVFAAKSLRSFFSIDEDTVCQPCKLKCSCKFMKQRVDKKEKLDLADALRVLIVHASNSGTQQLELSNEMKDSINKLLKEVVNLSK